MLLVYCDTCGFRISQDDLNRGEARQSGENQYVCAKCSAVAKPNTPSHGEIRAARITTPEGGSRSRIPAVAPRTPSGELRAESSKPPTTHRKSPLKDLKESGPKAPPLPVMAGAGALAALLIVWLVWPSSKDEPTPVSKNEVALVRADKPATPPNFAANTEPSKAPASAPSTATTPTAGPNAAAEAAPVRNMPSWMQKTGPIDSGPRRPRNDAQRDEGDTTIFFDDSLPPKAEENGTANVRFISWRWVPKPGPVFSGDYSHTVASEVSEKIHQHYFESASPALMITSKDILFAYAYIDPAHPPKTIMMQWNENKNWEHRAYWGDNLIPFGKENSAARRPMGPLPKAGEWVRLEVPASEVGFTGDTHSISGCSFDHFGGRVYFDKVGVLRKSPKPAAGPPPSAGTSNTVPEGHASLGRVLWNEIKGGLEFHNFWNKQKSSRAIWARPTQHNTFDVTFQAPGDAYTTATLAITGLRQSRKEPCRIALEVNGKIVFDGVDSSTTWDWSEQRYAFSGDILKSGANTVRILNMEVSGKHGAEPWFMVHAVELFAAPAK